MLYALLLSLAPGQVPDVDIKTEMGKLATLRSLRKVLGEEAYAKGQFPPPYPKKYEKEFKEWLQQQGAKQKPR